MKTRILFFALFLMVCWVAVRSSVRQGIEARAIMSASVRRVVDAHLLALQNLLKEGEKTDEEQIRERLIAELSKTPSTSLITKDSVGLVFKDGTWTCVIRYPAQKPITTVTISERGAE